MKGAFKSWAEQSGGHEQTAAAFRFLIWKARALQMGWQKKSKQEKKEKKEEEAAVMWASRWLQPTWVVATTPRWKCRGGTRRNK